MRKLFLFLLAPFIFSCGGTSSEKAESGNVLENLTFTVDTVLVDSGEEVIALPWGMGPFALTEDKSTLYMFELPQHKLLEVDLNQLSLIRKTEFEKEGPNGIGDYVMQIQLGQQSTLFLNGGSAMGKFSSDGQLMEDLRISPNGIDPELATNLRNLYWSTLFDFDRNRLFTIPSTDRSGQFELLIIDPFTKSSRMESMPKMNSVLEYRSTYMSESMIDFLAVMWYMKIENRQLLISSGSMSGFYRLDLDSEEFEFVEVIHADFPTQMDFKINNSPTELAEFLESRKKINEHLNYMDLMWDETREMYFRLGKKTFIDPDQKDQAPRYEIYLFAYDSGFRVVGQTQIFGLNQLPQGGFFKDGKLWSYVNVEDELGFAVFDLSF
ncbi:MAG: DUF4221 family protein [Algoriphagus aquaeductus]|uniref:DUF4221 family protein n=1 Tax=Algoriphagus TaxID=246875 RepID=UPI00258B6D8C|nr:DUF4221 family protein [Algoriphagus sp.]